MNEKLCGAQYYGNQIGLAAGAIPLGSDCIKSPTLSQNIEFRINSLENQVERLKRVKELLAEPGGIFNVPIDDLRFAMNY